MHFKVIWEQLERRISYQGPEDVDGEEGDGEGDEADRLQPALQLQVVLRSPQTQPAGDGRQGSDEEEAGHVAQQGALLTPRARVLQPLSGNTTENPLVDWKVASRSIMLTKALKSLPLAVMSPMSLCLRRHTLCGWCISGRTSIQCSNTWNFILNLLYLTINYVLFELICSHATKCATELVYECMKWKVVVQKSHIIRLRICYCYCYF